MKTIKLITFLSLFAILSQIDSLQAAQLKGDHQKRQITGFQGVSVSSGIDLYLTQKSVEEVSVEADQDDLDKIITQVEGGILKIYMKDKSWFNMSWNSKPHKVYVSFITLNKLDASAGSEVKSEGILKLDKMNLDASSGSDVSLELEVNEMSVEASSGSDITLKGRANTMQANASSGSDINANELKVKNCLASASSGSDMRINVSGELDAHASSGGDITYSGSPSRKDINESSGGDIRSR